MILKKCGWRQHLLRSIGMALIIGLVLSLCVGLGFAQQKVKLTWSEWWDQEWGRETIDWIISSFEKEHPNVEVETVFAPHAQYMDKLLTLCQAGEAPDVMSMEVTWAANFDKLGVFKDLDPLISEAGPEFASRHNPGWDSWWRDRIIMTYLYTMSYGIYYNKRMFEEKGIEPPTNWEEFRSALRKFHEPEKHQWGIALPLAMKSSAHFTLYNFWTRLIQAGGRMTDEEGLACFNSDAGVKALTYWGSLLAEGLVYPGAVRGALGIGEKEMIELFSAEQVPTQLTGPFLKTQVLQRNPEMEDNIALSPPFKDVTSGYLITGSGVSLSSQSEHPELAWEFIKHLLSDKVASKMVKERSLFWANTKALEFPGIKDDLTLRYLPEMIGDPASQPWSVLPQLGDLCDALMKNAQEYFLGKKDAQTALDGAVDYWNKVIKEAR
ncbi:MAG: sugar ABC transporter substrate-binding protein [Candidatus Aerophobetes bacterium]|nr:sugar ABC transporter substrate-binding protein [Candidatus Aerophobetes bacterium]